ncbi:glycosyltransferase family A protein [Pseudofrankia sp. DC12]|uniref:glycosyltransferase family 2 protein n=1 Tax=Pseudofrankia sp. DC12 TaxID=683315 RepID=UPI0006990818|nr:glycosyltransferase family A protein [Pseudofrankia sp. DC12]
MISVIIPTADRPGYLDRALRSLDRQSLRDFEVIVVADGGTPPEQVIDAWRGRLAITLLEVPQRRGVSHARNLGAASASGDLLAFLDDDDVFLPDHLAVAATTLADPSIEVAYGAALVSDRWIDAIPRTADGAAVLRKGYPFDPGFLLVANFIHTGAVTVRNYTGTSAQFDETLQHCEDWAMWLTLHAQGYRFAYTGACTSVYHQVQGASGTVAAAYQRSPTPFTLARRRLYASWPASDPRVAGYRRWITEFDGRLDVAIERGQPVPRHAFEHAIRTLYPAFTTAAQADLAHLDMLFRPPVLARALGPRADRQGVPG